jgi:hypothetical protein
MSSPLQHLRAGALAFLVAVLAALAALPAITASAGPPPSVTATPNPVIVPAGQISGAYTLAWTLGGLPSADFYVSINGAAPLGPFNEAMDGSNPANIDVNTTQVWKMYAKGDNKKALASVTVTAKHLDASCKSECVKLATVTPHGTFGQFHFITTKVLKKLRVEVHQPGQPDVADKTIVPGSNDWQPLLSGLKPNTLFDWKFSATDEAGNTELKTGTFKTLRRKVTVTYEPIKVIDDSDDLSAGDLKFWFGFANQMDTNSFGEVSVDSGDFTHPNHTSIRIDAPDTVGFVVVGQDNDCDFWDFCSLAFETPATGPVGHGSDGLSDWATASTTANVAVNGPGESFSGTKTFATTAFELEFSVTASFTVSYF